MDEIGIGEFAHRSRLSVKALRLYDELGVLVPARVDGSSGYRYYEVGQLEAARLVAMLRQIDVPLASVKELVHCEPGEAAERVAAYWREAETAHSSRRELADYIVSFLNGKRSMLMYEVATREMPQRSLLCVKRNVDEQGAWAMGKEFVALLRERSLPKLDGREGASFCIYWGQVSADSDGPIEWCRPVPSAAAKALAASCPELTLRTEPAHREAFVALALDTGGSATNWQLASEALQTWADRTGIRSDALDTTPEDLGVRMTYLWGIPMPDCDLAVPYAIAAAS